MSSTYTEQDQVGYEPAGAGHSHLISKSQKIVIEQDGGRCVIVMLQSNVKRDSLLWTGGVP